MSDKKKVEIIQDALNHLDDDMIEKVDRLRSEAQYAAERKKFFHRSLPWRQITAVAASVCLLVIGSYAFSEGFGFSNNDGLPQGTESAPNVNGGKYPNDMVPPQNDGVDQEAATEPPGEAAGETSDEMEPMGNLGDIMNLKDNYVLLRTLPHWIWENCGSEEHVVEHAGQIPGYFGEEYIKALVNEMCTAECYDTSVLPEANTEELYHVWFEKEDGSRVHCCIRGDGYMYYYEKPEVCIVVSQEVFKDAYRIITTFWQEE